MPRDPACVGMRRAECWREWAVLAAAAAVPVHVPGDADGDAVPGQWCLTLHQSPHSVDIHRVHVLVNAGHLPVAGFGVTGDAGCCGSMD